MKISEGDRQIIVGALDSLGVALADHDHEWTVGERTIYEEAVKLLTASSPSRMAVDLSAIGTFRGETIWKGMVEGFRVSKPPPERAYGWAVDAPEGVEYVAVLGEPPIDSPLAAVRAWIASQGRKT